MYPAKVRMYYSQWADILKQLIYFIIITMIELLIIGGNMYLAVYLDRYYFEWTNWFQVLLIIVSFNISGLVYAITYVSTSVNKVVISPIDLFFFFAMFYVFGITSWFSPNGQWKATWSACCGVNALLMLIFITKYCPSGKKLVGENVQDPLEKV